MGIVQGHWPSDPQGIACTRFPYDDEREVCEVFQPLIQDTKQTCRIELQFILLFRYFRHVRAEKLQKLANIAAEKAGKVAPVLTR